LASIGLDAYYENVLDPGEATVALQDAEKCTTVHEKPITSHQIVSDKPSTSKILNEKTTATKFVNENSGQFSHRFYCYYIMKRMYCRLLKMLIKYLMQDRN